MALRALPHCWAQLVGVLGQVKMYLGLIVLIKTYSPLFAAIGGWDGMDAGGAHWMTLSSPSSLGNISSWCNSGSFQVHFKWDNHLFMIYCE